MKVNLSSASENNAKTVSQPFFSIIITTFNRAHILQRAIDSLISQTEHDWEAIIVDDESMDENEDSLTNMLIKNNMESAAVYSELI